MALAMLHLQHLSHCLQIFMEDGISGFYRGCFTNLMRTTPAAALTFTSFELIARRLRTFAQHQRDKERESGQDGQGASR